jgi:gliding motility-associated-like protein
MKRFYLLLCCLLLTGIPLLRAQDAALVFVPNEGQWEQPFLYKGVASFADIYLENSGVTYVVGDADNIPKMEAFKESAAPLAEPTVLKYHAYKMKWLGARPRPATRTGKKQSYYYNYYLGNNPQRWKSNVSLYGNVDYVELYPHIDVHFSSDKGHAKYDFIVKPGGRPEDIQLAFEGLEGLSIEKGALVLQTSVGPIRELKPYAFQYVGGALKEVACRYALRDGILHYEFPDGYDPNSNLTIDPTVVFATLTGSTADNWGFTATYDSDGNLYAGGISSGLGYPTTTGAFQVSFGGGSSGSDMPCDITLSKFNATGSTLLYSTYLGGNADEMPHSLVVDATGNLIVAGKTLSTNFPTTTGAYDQVANGGYDILISRFNSSGTALLASTYLGGSANDGVNMNPAFYGNQDSLDYNYGDASRSEVIVDKAGNIYLAASSRSGNFPTTATAVKTSLGGSQDGIFVKMNSGLSNLLYSSYIGGSKADAAYVLALDTAQSHVYVGGGTVSTDFQSANTAGAYQSSYQGGIADGFICRFANSGSYTLLGATFVGTSAYDQVYGLQTDLEDGVYAMGQTLGAFPVSSGVYSNAGSRQFLIKLNTQLSSSVYSTVFGSGASAKPNISLVAFLVDTCQNVYISGWAAAFSSGSSTIGLPITGDAFQNTTDGSDFYFIVFSKNAQSLLFGSWFGSPGKAEHVDGGTSRFDPDGVVYQAICASCGFGSAFPATAGAYATVKGSNNCNLGAVKIAFNLGSVSAQAAASPATTGCAPLQVQFSNGSANATSYYWNFDDGGTSTLTAPTHTFLNPGTYNVMLVAVNPNACKTHDTTYVAITVSSDTIDADFDFVLADTCTDPHIIITNTSSPLNGQPLSSANYQWFFGDGGSATGAHPNPHYYTGPGAYTIMLVMDAPGACNAPDTIMKTLVFTQDFVEAGFHAPDTICVGLEAHFSNSSQNGSSYAWLFGDGQSDNSSNPVHTYDSAGTYTIRLIAANPLTCNKADTQLLTITVSNAPTADFTATPLQGELNVPTTFHNLSTGAVYYNWSFGDGQQSNEESPVHQYARTGSYTACLTAYNAQGCWDKICRSIYAEVQPLADLPSAFSPNGDGSNDVLYVRGYSIATMDLKIFNRWGEMVFESQRQDLGWDGRYKGKPQEMEAYAYTLQIVFLDGSKLHKQGNITLLR